MRESRDITDYLSFYNATHDKIEALVYSLSDSDILIQWIWA